MIGYVCRHKTVDGSTKLREKYDISADDACDRKSIPAWHLDFMGLTIFPTILHDRRESIAASYDLIGAVLCGQQGEHGRSGCGNPEEDWAVR